MAAFGRLQRGAHRMKLYSYWRSQASYRVRIALRLKGLVAETQSCCARRRYSADYPATRSRTVLDNVSRYLHEGRSWFKHIAYRRQVPRQDLNQSAQKLVNNSSEAHRLYSQWAACSPARTASTSWIDERGAAQATGSTALNSSEESASPTPVLVFRARHGSFSPAIIKE
jgi:hypothetical protein